MVVDVDSGQLVERFIDLLLFAFQDASGNVTVPPGGLTSSILRQWVDMDSHRAVSDPAQASAVGGRIRNKSIAN